MIDVKNHFCVFVVCVVDLRNPLFDSFLDCFRDCLRRVDLRN